MAIREMIAKLVEAQSLRETEAAAAMLDIVEGQATPSQISAFVVGLRMKGETAEEIAGLARIMRRYANAVDAGARGPDGDPTVIDVVGTGGDASGTFNISTVSAFVAAGAGAKIAKHGNRAVTSGCGTADVLEGLGIAIELPPAAVATCVREAGFGFMFAPIYHPAMRHAVVPRREIGVRTAFNLLGPITNPAGVSAQLTGVAVKQLTGTIAEVLRLLGSRRALVVHGGDGVDEISITEPTIVFDVRDGQVDEYEITPESVGLNRAPREAIRGGTLEANLKFVRSVLAGEKGAARDVVLLNAGAGLIVAGLAQDLADGVARAAESIDSGAAQSRLDAAVALSTRLKQEAAS
ncbi:MAG: anthranilate phosphoribosyltransferase [Chloroflexota bacterium]